MTNHADRMRDDIHQVASGDLAAVVEALNDVAQAFQSHSDVSSRLLLNHNTELAKLWDGIAELRDDLHDAEHALGNRIESLMQSAATLQDIDDAKVDMRDEIAAATATPFDPRPDAA